MKFIILLAAIFPTLSFSSVDICHFEDTVDFIKAIDGNVIKKTNVSNFETGFSDIEKQMIKLTINSSSYRSNFSLKKAIKEFGDFYVDPNEPGTNSGEIVYYSLGNKKIILVHYWPGDTEVGAFLKIDSQKITVLANVSDQTIECTTNFNN